MSNSYKNTSPGKSKNYAHNAIGENKMHVPPAGNSNSYEKVYKGQCAMADSSLRKGMAAAPKLNNK